MKTIAAYATALVLLGACAYPETETERFDDDEYGAPTTSVSGSGGAAQSGGSESAPSSSAESSSSAVTSGGGGNDSCVDGGAEPNDGEADAVNLGTVSDCDGDTTFEGVIDGNDEDWFVYQGSDDLGCTVDAYRELTEAAGGAPRVCQFAECDGLALECPAGTTPETSPEGRAGCCSTGPFALAPDCTGISDDATIYIRIDEPSGASCVPYGLWYHY